MNLPAPLVNRFLITFLLSLTVISALYFAFFAFYITPVLAVAESLVNLFFPSIRLSALYSPTSLEKSLGVAIGGLTQVTVPCNLFALVTNVIFAPSLVLATWGFGRQGLWRALAAIAIMIVWHALTVMIFVLDYLDYLNNPQHIFLTIPFPVLVMESVHGMRRFLVTQFSYVLPPFLIWVLLCFNPLSRLFSGSGQPAAEHPQPARSPKPGSAKRGGG